MIYRREDVIRHIQLESGLDKKTVRDVLNELDRFLQSRVAEATRQDPVEIYVTRWLRVTAAVTKRLHSIPNFKKGGVDHKEEITRVTIKGVIAESFRDRINILLGYRKPITGAHPLIPAEKETE